MANVLEVATEAQKAERLAEFASRDREPDSEDAKNRDFVMVFPKGWNRLQALIAEAPNAARLYAYLASHIDGAAGAVVASREVIAGDLGISTKTVTRLSQQLQKLGALVTIKVGGTVLAYCLDPEEVWRSWQSAKPTAAFCTRTLVRKADRENGDVRRKLKIMVGEPELPNL